MATNTNQKLTVLIDADNAQASVIQELLAEVALRHGHHEARLWRLDHAEPAQLEGVTVPSSLT